MGESKNAQSGKGAQGRSTGPVFKCKRLWGTFHTQATEEAHVLFLLGFAGLDCKRDGHILLEDFLWYSSYWKSGLCTALVTVQSERLVAIYATQSCEECQMKEKGLGMVFKN